MSKFFSLGPHRFSLPIAIAMLVLAGAVGCNQNPYLAGTPVAPTGGLWGSAGAPATVDPASARVAELSRRVQLLDDNNRQLHTQLAQSEQKSQVFKDESDLLRKQLADVSEQFQQSMLAARSPSGPNAVPPDNNYPGGTYPGGTATQNPSAFGGALAASPMPSQPSASIGPSSTGQLSTGQATSGLPSGGLGPFAGTGVRGQTASTSLPRPNTNLSQAASRLTSIGLPARYVDGTVRLRLPADQLFSPSTATLHNGAATTLGPVAAQLGAMFPQNRIGIEAYTDAGSGNRPPGATHELTAAQAAAVLKYLAGRGGLRETQLFTVAQGAANPQANNATPAGRAANRRIEIVVYP